jgi:hypothetical protein
MRDMFQLRRFTESLSAMQINYQKKRISQGPATSRAFDERSFLHCNVAGFW